MSIKCAFLFPGQGSQSMGMGKDFFNNSELAKKMLIDASTQTGIDFSELLFQENIYLSARCQCTYWTNSTNEIIIPKRPDLSWNSASLQTA